jgi:NAD(P)-dependent dehydrogenase (short-subunit alcohol dehydrogenase family)
VDTGLTGRSALVTGGAAGIGRAIALGLAAEGAQVIVADINAAQGQATVATIEERGGAARYVSCDTTDEAAVEAAVASVLAQEGQLDVMVNNAGISGRPAPLAEMSLENWRRVTAVDLDGVFLGVKHAARAMGPAGRGSIINMASIAGMSGAATFGPYGAAKAGVIQLTQTAALELARAGVRVNAICPGWIETAILDNLAPEYRSRLVRQVPLGRIGQPDDVVGMVVYLASDLSSFVTGSIFRVDGGIRS